MLKKALIIFLFLLTIKTVGFAQTLEIGGFGGGAGYMGDLNPDNPLKISGFAAGGFIKNNFNPYWSLGLYVTTSKIKGDDASSKNQQFRDRNLNFYTPLTEFALMVDFNFLDYILEGGRHKVTPYLYAGVGMALFNPKTRYMDKTYELRYYLTEGQDKMYENYALAIPYGVGVKYNIAGNWSTTASLGYRNAYTDYLDDVSGYYPDPSQLSKDSNISHLQKVFSDRSGENTGIYIGKPNTQRGDFRKRDTYLFVGIGITYTFVSQKCF
ncbi:DUF6089 family protein [Pedobacter sp.]|uniref:type IX secretion system protein PorG n=1 Tax=Pedobacter sp. TaxID=1411316 RepID=UPI00396C400D